MTRLALLLALLAAPALAQPPPDADAGPQDALDAGSPSEVPAPAATDAGPADAGPSDAGPPQGTLASTPVSSEAGGWRLPEGLRLSPFLDAFAEYTARFPTDSLAQNAFWLPRVQAGMEVQYRMASARLVVEGIQGTVAGGLLGTPGDGLRFREAWGGYRWRFLEAQVGLIPTLLIPELERAFVHRQLSADGLESFRLFAPADLGGLVRAVLPEGLGWVGVSVTNGEGFTRAEANPQKTFELAASVRPLAALQALRPLTVVAQGVLGWTGPAGTSANRVGGGVLWQGARYGGGVTATYGQGWQDEGTRQTLLVQGFVRAEFLEALQVALRVNHFRRNLAEDDTQTDFVGAVGVKVEPVTVFLAVQHTLLTGAALAALPGLSSTDVRLVVRARLPGLVE